MSRPEYRRSSHVDVHVHVYDSTVLRTRVHPGQGYVTVTLDGSGGAVTLYLWGAEVARLRAELGRGQRELTAG